MSKMGEWWRRIEMAMRGEEFDRELEEEMRLHRELKERELLATGVAKEEAPYAAGRQFGNTTYLKERGREAWGWRCFEDLMDDLRFGARMLRKNPGFAAVAIVTLALGIGANTAIFSVVNGVLLRALPFPKPDRIVQLAETSEGQTGETSVDAAKWLRLQEDIQELEYFGGYTPIGFNLATGTQAEHVRGMNVSMDYFRVLGIRPMLGRDFLADEDRGDGQRVVVISHELWVRQFGGDQRLLGEKVLLDGTPYEVIGVMPKGFQAYAMTLDNGAPEIWAPLALVAKTAGSGDNIGVIARVKPGVTFAQLNARMELVTQDFKKQFSPDAPADWGLVFHPYRQMIGLDARPYLLMLLGAIGFVLLIACANVANLLLARAGARTREISVRIALGASRMRLLRQLVTESMLLALAGGGLGFVVAGIALRSLLTIAPVSLPRVRDVHLDGMVFAFTCGISIVTGVLFGIAPSLHATKTNVNDSLKDSAGRTSAGPSRARLRQILVVSEFALSLVLLTGAGLMIATFARLLSTDPGFNPHRILSMQFWLNGSKYNSSVEIANFYRAVEQKLESLPGVETAAVVAAGMPLERGGNNGVKVAGHEDSKWISADYREITPEYFTTMGIPLKQGRNFSFADSEEAARVVIVNESFARRYLPARQALGQHLYVGQTWCEVVGVEGDVKSHLDEPSQSATFVPAAQAGYGTSQMFEAWFPRIIVMRTTGDPLRLSHVIREAVNMLDSSVPTAGVRSMDQVLVRSVALQSFMMVLLSIFGGLALVLASVGVYGVISYAVSQRTREIGVRVALGAQPADVLRLILSEGLRLVIAGVILGVPAAFVLTKLLQGFVYDVSVRNPLVFGLASALMILLGLAACYLPARRATRVDPMTALRYE
jgi:predicted permease